MYQPVKRLSVDAHAHADPGADRDIDRIMTTLCSAPHSLSQYGSVYIRVKACRHAERFPEGSDDIVIRPCQLRCTGDVTVGIRLRVQIDRAKASDAKCPDLLVLKKADHLGHCLLWCPRRDLHPLKQLSIVCGNRADHLCSACFNSSDPHNVTSFPNYICMQFFMLLY